MKLRNILTTTVAAGIAFASFAIAGESEVNFKGIMNFQAVHYKNNGAISQRIVTPHQENFGFYSAGSVFVYYNLVSESGVKYGTKLGLEHTFKNSRSVPASVFVEGSLGRFEGGSDVSAGQRMKITGYSAACEDASSWDFFAKTTPDKSKIAYLSSFCSFLDTKMRVSGKVDYSRKVTYFTPKFKIGEINKIQLGVSYVPDTANMGAGEIDDQVLHRPLSSLPYRVVIKDGMSYGITHELQLSEDTKIRTSYVGEHGIPYCYWIRFDAKGKEINGRTAQQVKNLNYRVIGSEISHKDISWAISYGNYNKSLTAVEIDKLGRDAKLLSTGLKYKLQKYALSINYFTSNYKSNKLDAITLGAEASLFKGFKSYLSTTFYQTNGKYFNSNNKLTFDKSKGNLIILGAKVTF